jgi:hypothetical protein
LGQRPHERRVLHVTTDHDILALADVGPDPDDQICIPPQEILFGHGPIVGCV